MSDDRLESVVEGIEEFRRFARPSADLSDLRARLGMPDGSGSQVIPSGPAANRKRRRPGQRKPHRDPVHRELS